MGSQILDLGSTVEILTLLLALGSGQSPLDWGWRKTWSSSLSSKNSFCPVVLASGLWGSL